MSALPAAAPKIVTVFGGSGFIGRHLVRRLAATGALVRVAVRVPEQAKFLKPMGDVGQVTPIAVNVRSDKAVAAAVAGADAVVNLVGILYKSGGSTFDAIHVEAAGRIAVAASAAKVKRLVHVSALAADPEAPSAYGRTKAAGEAAVKAAFKKATILRPSLVFGPEDNFFNQFAAMARLAPVLPLIGGGGTRFQPIYVGDVADAIMAALTRDDVAGNTYELGGPAIATFRELLEMMMAVTHRQRPLLPVPSFLAAIPAAVLEYLPFPPLTRDQVQMLKADAVVGPKAKTLADLGVQPTALEAVLPTYLTRFRPGGRFAPAPVSTLD